MKIDLTKKELQILILILQGCSNALSNNGCSAVEVPDEWSAADLKKFCKRLGPSEDSDGEEVEDGNSLTDWVPLDFLISKLEEVA